MGWVFTNPDPEEIDYVIPGNDDYFGPSSEVHFDPFGTKEEKKLERIMNDIFQPTPKIVEEESPLKLTFKKSE